MQTWVSGFCDRLIEAGWLVAALAIPLFFNFYSHRAFADKVALLRSLAVVIALAWLIKAIETHRRGEGARAREVEITLSFAWLRMPLVLPALLLAAVFVLTTITSVLPRVSLWGSYTRAQGTYTTLAYITIFLAILGNLRTRVQLERLVMTLVLASFPVALYGIIQRGGLDFGLWEDRFGPARVTSSLGNPIFLGGYLIMVVPLTLRQLIRAWSDWRERQAPTIPSLTLVLLYLLIALTQVATILFTGSRGPLLGLLVGLFLFALLWVMIRRGHRLALAVMGMGAVGGLLLVSLLLSTGFRLPGLGRVGVLSNVTGRVLIWQGTADLVASNPFRLLIGYGPETLQFTFVRHFPPGLAEVEVEGLRTRPDRAHNLILDVLATTGLVGLAAYLFLFTAIFYHGLIWLGLIRTREQGRWFLGLWLGAGFLSSLGVRLAVGSWRYVGVAMQGGTVAGLLLYLTWWAFASRQRQMEPGRPYQVLLIALLTGVAAHWVELVSGIAVETTRTTFWVYLGLLVIAGHLSHERFASLAASGPATGGDRQSQRVRAGRRQRGRDRHRRAPGRIAGELTSQSPEAWRRSLLVNSMLMSIILGVMAIDFIVPFMPARALVLPLITWLIGSGIILAHLGTTELRPVSAEEWLVAGLICLTVSVGPVLAFTLGYHQAVVVASFGRLEFANLLNLSFTFLILLILALVAALEWGLEPAPRWWRGVTVGWLYALLAVGALFLIVVTNLNVIKADVYFSLAWDAYKEPDEWDWAMKFYDRALRLAPEQDYYWGFLGIAWLERYNPATSAQERLAFEESRRALERAWTLNPLNVDWSLNLAHLFRRWSEMVTDPQEQTALLNAARWYEDRVVQLSPGLAEVLGLKE